MKITLAIIKVTVYADGNAVVFTKATKQNDKGRWRFNPKQVLRLAGSAGVQPSMLGLLKGNLVITGDNVKAGQTYVGRDGVVGTYTKDHFRVEDSSIELSPIAQQMALTANAMAGMFATTFANTTLPDSDGDDVLAIDEPEQAQSLQAEDAIASELPA